MKRDTRVMSDATGGVGCLVAGIGAASAPLAWAPRASGSVFGGFEGENRDPSVLFVDLPLIALGGALLPLVAWMLATRWTGRPWAAALMSLAALSLGIWGLLEWWVPRHPGEAGYEPGA